MNNRVAVFYITTDDKSKDPRYTPIQFSGATVYIRGKIAPFGTSCLAALDAALPESGESVMNSHYID